MNISLVRQFVRTMVWDKGTLKFSLSVILGLAFSIAVILSTVGLMDGFEHGLREHLSRTEGEITVYSRQGFFAFDKEVKNIFEENELEIFSGVSQIQGFVIREDVTKGVLIRGVDSSSFSSATSLKLDIAPGEVAIGMELADQMGMKAGDEVAVAFAYGNKLVDGLPLIRTLKIRDVISHGVFEKDLRYVYVDRGFVQEILGLGSKINNILVKAPAGVKGESDLNHLVYNLNTSLPINLSARPYWQEFATLLEAVEIEKLIITLILQVVVVVSIFNVLALIYFLNEKKSKEIFLFSAMGMSTGVLARSWFFISMMSWMISCLVSLAFVRIFDWSLGNLDFLKLPGEIYHMGRLGLSLDAGDYSLVFMATLAWMLIMVGTIVYRLRKMSPIQGLRKEFG